MTEDADSNWLDDFEAEHAKRDKRISYQQSQMWADELLACLPDSVAYRQRRTPQARLEEQAQLNRWNKDWFDKRADEKS